MHSREKPVGYVRTHFHQVILYVHVHILVRTCTGAKIMAEDFLMQVVFGCTAYTYAYRREAFYM